MEITAILLLLVIIARLSADKTGFKLFSAKPRREIVSHQEYIKNVVASRNQKYLEEKKLAANKERIKKNFL